jgi:hypothetical protein
MAEDLESIAARNRDKGHSAGLGRADRKRGRSGHCDQYRAADRGRLLHELNGDTAGKNNGARVAGDASGGEGAGPSNYAATRSGRFWHSVKLDSGYWTAQQS